MNIHLTRELKFAWKQVRLYFAHMNGNWWLLRLATHAQQCSTTRLAGAQGRFCALQDDHFRISETFMELPGVRYFMSSLKLQEAWGWILTQSMTALLAIFAGHEQHAKKVQ